MEMMLILWNKIDTYIIENNMINILIHDIFAPMDDKFNDIHDVPLTVNKT
jgi:hypothetical protein